MATCFHHTDRETGRACTRCGRSACPDCLIQASVGSQCFECVKRGAPKRTVRIRQTLQRDPLVATKLITAITIGGFLLIALRDGNIDGTGNTADKLALLGPAVQNGDWWRLFSYSLVHYGLLHIGSNLLMLWIVGRVLEPITGPIRFATIYVVSVLGGAAGALIATPHGFIGGASGGVFGVAAAATLVLHRQGIRFWDAGFGPLLLINLALGLFISNISLGGHIGGLVAGALTAEGMLQARKLELPLLGYVGALLVAVVSVGIAFAVVG
jgi:membrane associated rhomboid family serine protease